MFHRKGVKIAEAGVCGLFSKKKFKKREAKLM